MNFMLWLCICVRHEHVRTHTYRVKETHGDVSTTVTPTLFLVFLLAESGTTCDDQVSMGALSIVIGRRELQEQLSGMLGRYNPERPHPCIKTVILQSFVNVCHFLCFDSLESFAGRARRFAFLAITLRRGL